MTIVVDLLKGNAVFATKGRKIESFEEFVIRLKESKADIRGIAVDMWPNYQIAIKRHFSEEIIVFDRYHVISECNRVLQGLCKSEWSRASKSEKVVFQGTRYLLLKGQEKLEGQKEAKQRLNKLLNLNERLNMAYILKEELREFWNCSSREQAKIYLDNWTQKVDASGIPRVKKFAKKIYDHIQGILNYFCHRITTGPVEGTNNKIKVLKRMAYGFRDFEYFKLRIYDLHKTRNSLLG